MEYLFYDQGDERLLELAQNPTEGIAVAIRTTGYTVGEDEVVELAVVNLDGQVLLSRRAKPQNKMHWDDVRASGGIMAADVANEPELYQFEDEIIKLFDEARIVVCEHLEFVRQLVEASWVTLPEHEGFDLDEEFRKSHSVRGYSAEPAAAVALPDIASYYGIDFEQGSLADEAAAVAACYRELIQEHARERDAKGSSYWQDYERRMAEQDAQNRASDATARLREKRYNQMNGLLWVAGGIIFTSLVIQLYQRGGDVGFMVVAGAAAVFCLVRAVVNFRK